MSLEDIFVYELDRSTSKLECVRIRPTRLFHEVPLREDGKWAGTPGTIIWQAGKWYDLGWNEIPETEVPEKHRKAIAENPVVVSNAGPAVTTRCRFCGEEMNQSEMEHHLIGHVNTAMADAGKVTDETVPPQIPGEKRTAKYDANRLGR